MIPVSHSTYEQLIDAASVEQARCLRAIPKANIARELSIAPRTYSKYLRKGFPADLQPARSRALTVPPEFFQAAHPRVFGDSNINSIGGRKAQAAHRDAAIANGNLLT